jgi:hypothetical protein
MRRPAFRMGGGLGKGPRIAPGAGAPAGPTLRGHNLTLSQSGSVVAPFVTGAAAGDTAFLFCSDAWAATAPAGWSTLANDTGAFINGAIFTKVLSAGDISAGNVTVSFAGGYGEAVAQACFIGAVTVRDSIFARNDAGNETFKLNDATDDILQANTGSRLGHRTISRTASNVKRGFFNGVRTANLATASTGISGAGACWNRDGGSIYDDRYAAVYYGSGLSDAEVANVHLRLNTFLTAIGAN